MSASVNARSLGSGRASPTARFRRLEALCPEAGAARRPPPACSAAWCPRGRAPPAAAAGGPRPRRRGARPGRSPSARGRPAARGAPRGRALSSMPSSRPSASKSIATARNLPDPSVVRDDSYLRLVIAKVEPLTTARSLARAVRLPAGGRAGRCGRRQRARWSRSAAAGCSGWWSTVAEDSEIPPERLVEPLAALEEDVPAELVRLGLWVAREYCSTPARGLALVLPPGTGTGARRVRARRRLVATPRRGSRRRRAGARLGIAAAGGAERARRRPTGRCRRCPGRPLHAAPPRSARPGHGLEQTTDSPRRPRCFPSVPPRRAPRSTDRAGERPCGGRGGARSRRARGAAPAARRHRQRQDGGLPASGGRRARARPLGDRPRAGDRADAADRGPLRRALRRLRRDPALAALGARALRRVGAAALRARRACAWDRARRSSRRSTSLGLIVIDEEHDASYKQEGDPRYDARHVAERRASEAGAVLLAGSATPRPESRRRYAGCVLSERIDGRALPPVELVAARRTGLTARAHARGTRRRRRARREGDRPAEPARLVELPVVSSVRTGRGSCPDCDVTLVLHRASGEIALPPLRPPRAACRPSAPTAGRCRWRVTARAPSGSSASSRRWWRRCPCFGSTPTPRRTAGARSCGASTSAPAGVLVGTQMVAKGHDFPDVTLGVVLDADATLRFPDFRAEERTFALVAQLAGRSGRGERGRPRDRAGARPGRPRAAPRGRPRRRRLPRRASSSAARRWATRRSDT